MKSARKAYEEKDKNLSIKVHEHPESHKISKGKYSKAIVFGALDGIITTFALITASISADILTVQILILGLAQIFADGFSMGFGEYLSSEIERNYYNTEKKRERWECDNYLQGERDEMIDIYIKKGIDKDDAIQIVNLLSKNIDSFVDVMMIEELQLTAVDSAKESLKNGSVMFFSFLFFGFIPLVPYIFEKNDYQYMFSFILTCILLFILGIYGSIIGSQKWYISGIKMLIQGSISAGIAFSVSWVADKLI